MAAKNPNPFLINFLGHHNGIPVTSRKVLGYILCLEINPEKDDAYHVQDICDAIRRILKIGLPQSELRKYPQERPDALWPNQWSEHGNDAVVIPGVKFEGHRLFFRLKPEDPVWLAFQAATQLGHILRVHAIKDPAVGYKKQHECDHLWPRPAKLF